MTVSIDGQAVAAAAIDEPRPDVAAALGLPVGARPGWSLTLPLARRRSGTSELTAHVRGADGALSLLARTSVTFLAHEPRAGGHIDLPSPGVAVSGATWVRGWALFPTGPAASVTVSIGDRTPRPARIGVDRADLGVAYPGIGDVAGFEEILDFTGLAPGTGLVVQATATAIDGTEVELEPVRCVVAPAPPGLSEAEAIRAAVLRQRAANRAAVDAPPPGTRLAVFTHQLDYGGGQLYLHELLRQWAAEPGFSAVVVSQLDGGLRPELEAMGIEVHICGRYPVLGVDEYEGKVHELMAWAEPYGFNLAFVNTMLAFPGADVAGRLGLPVTWAIHESFELPVYWELAYGPGGVHPYARERAVQALQSAQLVAFEADATRRLYQPFVSNPVTLPYGVATEEIERYMQGTDRAAERQRLEISPLQRVILCLGTIEPRKSQAVLARAFEEIAGDHRDARLVFVGDNGSASAAALRRYVERSPFADRVRILPVTPEIFPWYVAADLLVSASDVESLPRSVLEAMAFGLPVLAADVFGLPELIEDGVTGFLCPARDVRALAGGLDRVLSLPRDEVLAVAAAGKEAVRKGHDSSQCAADYWRRMIAPARREEAVSPP